MLYIIGKFYDIDIFPANDVISARYLQEECMYLLVCYLFIDSDNFIRHVSINMYILHTYYYLYICILLSKYYCA